MSKIGVIIRIATNNFPQKLISVVEVIGNWWQYKAARAFFFFFLNPVLLQLSGTSIWWSAKGSPGSDRGWRKQSSLPERNPVLSCHCECWMPEWCTFLLGHGKLSGWMLSLQPKAKSLRVTGCSLQRVVVLADVGGRMCCPSFPHFGACAWSNGVCCYLWSGGYSIAWAE